MSKFLHSKYKSITPYDTSSEIESFNDYIRLNTNESPFSPSPLAVKYASEAASGLNYYSDPECSALSNKLSEMLGVSPTQIVFGNGSDEILNFLFSAFCERGCVFPDITYSFYKILADFHGVDYRTIALNNFYLLPVDYVDLNGRTIFVANPNAPTGIYLIPAAIETLIIQNPQSLVVVDEAYIDFAGRESALKLIRRYKNVVIVRTFSKSRSLAGARLGYCVTNEELAQDIRNIKNTLTPYNINAMTQAAGLGSLEDDEYYRDNINLICSTRQLVKPALEQMGFEVLESATNFLFARHENISGARIFEALKERKIMIRHFMSLSAWNRITIGTPEQMQKLLRELGEIINHEA
ncbi:MAG: histidinol-phosphate transaminase [Synergistaceae bacterium]|nr:histidinol-phosphate transaminase [Synergistaceae bacterium]